MKKTKSASSQPAAYLEKYSVKQRQAVENFEGDMAVSAGPGSGKTSVLVERFLHAATVRRIDAERILAITFTEKAAQEMKSRLVEVCQNRGLSDLRKKLENASVSTIDSFCARLLKENPIEAGIDPYFQILGEGEAEILMERLLDEIFQNEPENPCWLRMLVDFGEDEMRTLLKRYYFKTHSRKDGDALLRLPAHEAERQLVENKISSICRYLIAETDGGGLKDTEALMREAALDLTLALKDGKSSEGWAFYDRIRSCLKKIKRMGRLKETAEEMQPIVSQWLELLAENISEPYKREFIRIYRQFESAYEAEKMRLASYDFTDLLYKAHDLLGGGTPEKKALKARYQEYFSHILIDEYQDTSPLQAELVGFLKNNGNLFVVGDLRQSIYSFRQAEPGVLRERISASTALTLNENYRSRPEILNWVNRFFQSVFPAEGFEELAAKRVFKKEIKHAIELLCVVRGKEETESMEEARVEEASAIAQRIAALVKEGFLIEKRGGRTRPICYGDIAVLLRSTTSSALYEKELLDLDIPYYVVKGKGFYGKPEVKDLIHYLKWLENPDLDISLACILRSPLFGISDDGLFWISRHAKKHDKRAPLYQALKNTGAIEHLSMNDKTKIDFFVQYGTSLRLNKNRYKISEIFENLVRDTAYEAKLLAGQDGRRKIANIRKLIDMARVVEESNVFGVGDFIRYVESLADRDTAEEEAKVDPQEGDAVVISSIHAAKGLEFPCVIVADLGRSSGGQNDAKFISSISDGLGMKLKNPGTSEQVKDTSYSRIHAEMSRKEAAEEGRLLYVAMTRAKELLILSGSAAINAKNGELKKTGSWMGHVLGLLDRDPRECDLIHFEEIAIKVLRTAEKSNHVPDAYAAIASDPAVRLKLAAAQALSIDDFKNLGLNLDEPLALEIDKRLQSPLKPYTSVRDTTVTELLARDGGDEEPDRPTLGITDDENLPRNELGTLFHKAMEASLHRISKGGKVNAAFFESMLKGLNESEKKEMTESILKFWKGSLGKAIRKSSPYYPELPFIYKTPYGLLKGQLDLVFRTASGEWIILDYKTNKITSSDLEETAASYEFQLGLYALVFHELYGEMPAKGILYFSSIDKAHEFTYSAAYLKEVKERLYKGFVTLGGSESI